jgi:futalosine hydrolase
MPADLIVCVATELEGALLRPHLPVLVTGVGAVNAACALTRYLERQGVERESVRAIISCGIGGGYPDAGFPLASAVWAESECYGDLGAASDGGFLDMRALGFPLIAGPEPVYNRLPVTIRPCRTSAPFVTVNTCTGDDAAARAIAARTGGGVENMEGAAIAHVAALYAIPAGEVRGISNFVGKRDRSMWRVKEAAAAAQQALLDAWRGGELTPPS